MFRKKKAKAGQGGDKRQVIKSGGGGTGSGRSTGAMLKEFFFGGVRLVVTLVIAGVVVVIFGSRIVYLQGQADASRADGDQVRAATEDKQLFYDLLRVRLLIPRQDGGLTMRSSDFLMIKEAQKDNRPPPGVNRAEQGRFLRLLYNSPAGVIVRQQVRLWNETRRIAGIRDNRTLGPSDKNKVFWRAFTPNGHPIATGSLMPETFGFVQGNVLSTGFGEWVTVPKRQKAVVYRTRVPAGQGRSLTVQVVGNPIKVPRGARVTRVKLEKYKQSTVKHWPCEIPMFAAVVAVPLTGGAQNVEITVQPAVNCSPIIFGLAIRLVHRSQLKDAQKKVYVPGKGMVEVKDEDGRNGRPEKTFKAAFFGDWYFAWREVKRAKKAVTGGAFTIRTRDGQLLTDNSGKGNPTELTYAMGMVSLIGFGVNDAASLAGLLRQSKIPAAGLEVALTIDGRIQRIVAETMRHYFTKVFRGTRFDKRRKGAVVLMDAETGAIVAIGGWPLPQRGATAWDYTSFAVSNPNRDPMAIMAWEVIDGNNTPGSTFKPLLALAIMRSKRARLMRVMKGLTPAEFPSVMGISPGLGAYPIPGSPKSIANFGNSSMAGYFGRVSGNALCGNSTAADPTLGVKQAVQFSLNVWFSRIAVMLDTETADRFIALLRRDLKAKRVPKQIGKLPRTNLMKLLADIGIDDRNRTDLASNVPARLGLFRFRTDVAADILYTQRLKTHITSEQEKLDTWRPIAIRPIYLHRIGLNGIGQGWSVSALHMARGASAIASGKRVAPWIIKRWGSEELKAPPAPVMDLPKDLLALLRQGMKAVTEAPGATATGTFNAVPSIVVDPSTGVNVARNKKYAKALASIRKTLKCRAHGKTGTADVGKGLGYNSGWFVGWKNPVKPDPTKVTGRKIAYACMTTHAMGGFRFGGSSCGRVIRDILTSIELMENPLGANAAKDDKEKTRNRRRGRGADRRGRGGRGDDLDVPGLRPR